MGNITLPTPGVTPGPEWASTLNQAITDVNTTASAAVPNTPEGRQALAESPELSATFAPLHGQQVVAVGGSGSGNLVWWEAGGDWQVAPLLSDAPGWSNADHTYTIPETGIYLCVGTMRLCDYTANANIALTVWRSLGDGPHVAWYGSGTSMRQSLIYTTVERFTAGERIFLETYIDAAVPVAFAAGRLAIARIG